MFDKIDFGRTILAGLAGTAAMTALMLAAPMMGMPPMNIGEMLGSMLGGVVALGWAAHFMIGVALAGVYAAAFAHRLPGPVAVRGALYGIGPWLLAQVVVMPMMGAGLFSGSALVAAGSLMGHLVYGAVVGTVYGHTATAHEGHAVRGHA
ncbi:DUF1440 domain-containing protein [Myxococcota bacterium]|nr:DUF1440 domain-containing protein [Myxococcota bacterium]